MTVTRFLHFAKVVYLLLVLHIHKLSYQLIIAGSLKNTFFFVWIKYMLWFRLVRIRGLKVLCERLKVKVKSLWEDLYRDTMIKSLYMVQFFSFLQILWWHWHTEGSANVSKYIILINYSQAPHSPLMDSQYLQCMHDLFSNSGCIGVTNCSEHRLNLPYNPRKPRMHSMCKYTGGKGHPCTCNKWERVRRWWSLKFGF